MQIASGSRTSDRMPLNSDEGKAVFVLRLCPICLRRGRAQSATGARFDLNVCKDAAYAVPR